MNLFHYFRAAVLEAVAGLVAAGVLPDGLDLAAVAVEPPRDPSHGDLATNAALVLARAAKARPRDLADQLVARLKTHPAIAALDVAGPGFINFRLAPAFWHARLADILVAGPHYGDTDLGRGRAVNVEYVSANPTGPMHVGHGRGAVIGDALANLLEKAGFRVTREYYINDAGAQVDMLARSAHLRYREALGETISAIPEGLYPGDYLKPVGAALAAAHGARFQGKPESEWLELFRSAAVDAMMALIRADLVALGVRHAIFTSERALHQKGAVEEAVAVLEAKDLVYTGVLEPPKGMKLDDWEPRPQTLFRSTRFGDDVDRPLRKSDGSWTYFAGDIAYHLDKVRRGSHLLIDVWGADHGGYVKRMQAAVTALSGGEAVLDVKLCQLVNLLEKGEPVKMSKRAGTFVTLRDVVDQVGKDVVRFIMLTRKNDAALDFDLARVVEQSRDNPVFYVQYAHARARSVLRHAAAAMPNEDLSAVALARADATLLDDPDEIGLIRHMAAWPRIVEAAAESHEPHRIAFYLNDLAAAFHGLWNRGKDEAALRFIRADAQDLTRARLALVQATALVIAVGLGVFAVKPVEEMR